MSGLATIDSSYLFLTRALLLHAPVGMSLAKKTLYVGGLAESVTVQMLTAAFIPFGDLVGVCSALLCIASRCRAFYAHAHASCTSTLWPLSARHRRRRHSSFAHTTVQVDVQIPMDKNNSHRGFGFVEFDEKDDALAAIDNMHGAELAGRTLKCNIAKPNTLPKNIAGLLSGGARSGSVLC